MCPSQTHAILVAKDVQPYIRIRLVVNGVGTPAHRQEARKSFLLHGNGLRNQTLSEEQSPLTRFAGSLFDLPLHFNPWLQRLCHLLGTFWQGHVWLSLKSFLFLCDWNKTIEIDRAVDHVKSALSIQILAQALRDESTLLDQLACISQKAQSGGHLDGGSLLESRLDIFALHIWSAWHSGKLCGNIWLQLVQPVLIQLCRINRPCELHRIEAAQRNGELLQEPLSDHHHGTLDIAVLH
jgi:hypothetical protein